MNKLFKDMFVQNLKKDRSIFLSIFLFLILSFSTMLGIFNFSLNFRSGLPDETFNKQKLSSTITSERFRWDDTEGGNAESNFYFKSEVNDEFVRFVIDKGFSLKSEEVEPILKELFNNYSGDSLNEEFLNKMIPNADDQYLWKNFIGELAKTTSVNNPFFSFFNEHILSEINKDNKYQLYKDSEYKLGNQLADKKFVMYLNKNDPISNEMLERAMKGKNNLEFTEDVIYSTNYAANKYGYKVGQKITLVGQSKSEKGNLKEFIYGGAFSEIEKLITFRSKDKDIYFINSFNGLEDDYKYISNHGISLYNGDIEKLTDGILEDLKPYLDEEVYKADAHNWIINEDAFSGYYKYFVAMTVLFVSLFFLLLALDILLSFFMIKELILKNAENMLFLKAMGYKNIELGLLNSLSILGVLFPTFLAAIAGQFLVQKIFSTMIQSYIESFWTWSTISAWTFPFLILLILLNLLFFVVLSTRMISKMQLRENKVVRSNKLFNAISGRAFKRNTNLGIGVHLYFKNISKIMTTFIISFLIMGFMFVTFGFSVSVEQGGKRYAYNYGNYNVGSYFKVKEIVEKDDGTYETSIKYSNRELDESKNLANLIDMKEGLPSFKDDLTGYYIYRNDIEKVLNGMDNQFISTEQVENIKVKIRDFINMYENIMSTQFGVHNYNFLISFGEYHYDEKDVVEYKTDVHNYATGYGGRLIAVNDESNIYKNLFNRYDKKQKYETWIEDEKYFHIPVIANTLFSAKVFEDLENSIWNITYGNYYNYEVPLSAIDSNCNLEFKFDLIDAKPEIYEGDIFMRRDDLNSYLEWIKNKSLSDYDEALVENILDNKLNNYLYSNDIIPSVLKQIVVPKTEIVDQGKTINENYFDEMQFMSNDVNQVIKLDLLSKMVDRMKLEISPMLTLMNFLLIISFLIFLIILIFIVIMMTNENYEFIRTMTYLGYSKNFTRRNLVTWYILAFGLAELFAVLFSVVLLKIINNDFIDIIKMNVSFSFEWENILAVILVFIILTGLVFTLINHNMKKIVANKRIE